MIILIILYTLLIFVSFSLDGTDFADDNKMLIYYIEIAILASFCMDIGLHIYAYWKLYLMDMWNIFDLIVIILSIVMVILDMLVDNAAL